MADEHTTAVVQRYLDALTGDAPAEPIVRALVDRAVRRLQSLGTNLLYRSYPRLARPPLNLAPDELLGTVVEDGQGWLPRSRILSGIKNR